MKKILIVLLLLPVIGWGQIPKGSTKIIVSNTFSAKENFDKIIKALMDNDYFIEAKDADLFTVKTQPKKPIKGHGLYYMNLRAIDNEIHVSGLWKSGIELSMYGVNSTDSYAQVVKRGGAFVPIFESMDSFATFLEGSKTYK